MGVWGVCDAVESTGEEGKSDTCRNRAFTTALPSLYYVCSLVVSWEGCRSVGHMVTV